MAQVNMPEKKKGALDTAQGLLSTAATVASLRKDIKSTPKDQPDDEGDKMGAINRRIDKYGRTT